MTKKQAQKILLREYVRALKSVEKAPEYEEYRAGINYFMGWLSNDFEITVEEVREAREELYK